MSKPTSLRKGFVNILTKRALFSLLDEADYNIDELLVKLSDKVDW